MAKNQGVVAGALVVAGVMLRPLAMVAPSPAPTNDLRPAARAVASTAESKGARGEGPWIASCQYWASVRGPHSASKPDNEPPTDFDVDFRIAQGIFTSKTTGSLEKSPPCPNSDDAWGIPGPGPKLPPVDEKTTHLSSRSKAQSTAAQPEPIDGPPPQVVPDITAIIATVPDPSREHLSLNFDQTIEGLLEAAADNNYLESYSWLPWKDPAEIGGTGQPLTEKQEEDENQRLRQPGLIILKHVKRVNDLHDKETETGYRQEYVQENYYKVVYLFLVGDTPVEGVDGEQLQNALRAQKELRALSPRVKLSLNDKEEGHLTVIGPDTSGAAASLVAQLESGVSDLGIKAIDIAGGSGTQISNELLNTKFPVAISSVSFTSNIVYERNKLLQHICRAGYDTSRVALLIEDGTAYGWANAASTKQDRRPQADEKGSPPDSKQDGTACDVNENNKDQWGMTTIRFPRGISLLRNAHEESDGQSENSSAPSSGPYLRMSLRDRTYKGGVPHFSTQTPVSQEGVLSSITRQIKRYRTQFVVIQAADTLDGIFLARFLHRAVPDVRLVSSGGDLLDVREVENEPFIGAISTTPYNLVAPVASRFPGPYRPFSSSIVETVYNAASYTFWDPATSPPYLSNYRDIFTQKLIREPAEKPDADGEPMSPSLWVTTIGRDGYYPVGLLSRCASDSSIILPLLHEKAKAPRTCDEAALDKLYKSQSLASEIEDILIGPVAPDSISRKPHWRTATLRYSVSPSLPWYAICTIVLLGCIVHLYCISFASFWSPVTRDLAIANNDQPRRRTLYIHIGTVMLFCVAFVVSFPLFPALRLIRPQSSAIYLSSATLLAGVAVLIYSFVKSGPYAWGKLPSGSNNSIKSYVYFHVLASIATVGIPALWILACGTEFFYQEKSFAWTFFSYRCLTPFSGVSPLLPVLLLLLAWYSWSVLQCRRLRFSPATRPRLPSLPQPLSSDYHLYVAEEDLAFVGAPPASPLFEEISCLLITPSLLGRLFKKPSSSPLIVGCLTITYLLLFAFCVWVLHLESLERIFSPHGYGFPTPYEFLIEVLFFPLLMISLTGLLRMLLIWSDLQQGVLRAIEQMPLRSAFSRLNSVGWIAMLRQSDLHERWREMSRSLESMRQMGNDQSLNRYFKHVATGSDDTIRARHEQAVALVNTLLPRLGNPHPAPYDRSSARTTFVQRYDQDRDHPLLANDDDLLLMYLIECEYAAFAELLIKYVLNPYWYNLRMELVEAEEFETVPVHARRLRYGSEKLEELALHAGRIEEAPLHIRVAEEFVAIRYVSLIRAVLVNIRHLLTFVISAFVLSMIAWNSYPFRPRSIIDLGFTSLFLLFGVSTIWMFAQMYRDTLLSRITRTVPNELGGEFYLRIVTFGAIPLITWLAYQFPSIGGFILKYIQPGLEVVK